ncbi:MAG: hypothetical protein R2753_15795 [Chitinophagales bacterium]
MKNFLPLRIVAILVILLVVISVHAQDTKSAVLLANHTDLEFTTAVRITGAQYMVDIGKSEILPWEGAIKFEKSIQGRTEIHLKNWDAGLYLFEWYKNNKLIGTESIVKQ